MNYQISNYWTIKHFELKMSAQLVTQNENLHSYARILQKKHQFILCLRVPYMFQDCGLITRVQEVCEKTTFVYCHTTWLLGRTFRTSHRRCSARKGVLSNFAKFTGKHLCQSPILSKVAGRGLQISKNTF